ncbi:hypothetical protein AQ490_19680 [Wenjunlia vitaminophila]|uniref:Carbohydrate kinase PfkB domain-containing protein n=1 Tax=Wenjunlia vitaminophila TaxID=76728 RepID=A0A0T6LV00_WENVI|nr:carbohydrate kinase [Wenjunlia vitaminophila]KRV49551.1 hypothetical protein AQ490_19680 [Wenjunlia vitaminophila]
MEREEGTVGNRVTVVGEALVDLLWETAGHRVTPVPGGSPANVAVGLHRLGRPVTLVTTWADDPPGELVRAHLESTGVDVRRAPDSSGRSMLALAYLDGHGSASYDFLTAWAPEELTVPDDTAVLHTGSLAVVVEPGASAVLRLCRRTRDRPEVAVVADLNVRPAVLPDRDAYRDACLRLAAATDVVKASDEDLAWLFGHADPVVAARTLLAAGPRLVVVTLGAAGALAVTEGTEVRVPARRTTVVDTVGAGDAFQAALLDALADRCGGGGRPFPATPDELTAVLSRCVTAASVTCSRVGAVPPTAEELAAARAG